MSYERDVQAAKEKMLQAELALERFLQGRVHDFDLAKQLIIAETSARDEYISQLATLVNHPMNP